MPKLYWIVRLCNCKNYKIKKFSRNTTCSMNRIVACLESIQFIPENNVFNTLHHTSHPWTHLITSNIRSLSTHHSTSNIRYHPLTHLIASNIPEQISHFITSNIRAQKQNHPKPVAFAPWWNILSYFSVISRNLKNATVVQIWMKSKCKFGGNLNEI